MKLQKNTLLLLITALLLGGVVYIYEIKGKEKQTVIQEKAQKIFNFIETDIKSLKIEREKEILEFEKTTDELLPWSMIKPDKIKAEAGAISFLINPLVGEDIKSSFSISAKEKADYGLDKPIAKLTIILNNNQTYKLIFGKPNFDEKFVYTLIDPVENETSKLTVNLLPISLKYAVERPLSEWKYKENNNSPTEEENKENQENDPEINNK